MHLSDSRLASGREGLRFSGLEVIEMKRKRKSNAANWGGGVTLGGLTIRELIDEGRP
jgi:hypothetical protein